MGDCSFSAFLKIKKAAKNIGLHFSLVFVIILTKNMLGYILGYFSQTHLVTLLFDKK
jgi:hypothetical protein